MPAASRHPEIAGEPPALLFTATPPAAPTLREVRTRAAGCRRRADQRAATRAQLNAAPVLPGFRLSSRQVDASRGVAAAAAPRRPTSIGRRAVAVARFRPSGAQPDATSAPAAAQELAAG